jgi:cyclophilin family peptidyl-prolyl cis-trans isomerase
MESISLVGKVTKGFAVVDSIAKVEVMKDYKPVNDVVIKSIYNSMRNLKL